MHAESRGGGGARAGSAHDASCAAIHFLETNGAWRVDLRWINALNGLEGARIRRRRTRRRRVRCGRRKQPGESPLCAACLRGSGFARKEGRREGEGVPPCASAFTHCVRERQRSRASRERRGRGREEAGWARHNAGARVHTPRRLRRSVVGSSITPSRGASVTSTLSMSDGSCVAAGPSRQGAEGSSPASGHQSVAHTPRAKSELSARTYSRVRYQLTFGRLCTFLTRTFASRAPARRIHHTMG